MANSIFINPSATSETFTNLIVTGTATVGQLIDNGLTASQAVFTDSNKQLVSNAITGTGSVVMNTSPTLVTPALGVSSGTSLALSGATISSTGTGSFLSIAGTWNGSGVNLGALLLNITDTASGAASLAFAINGGASASTNLFKVDKGGNVTIGGNLNTGQVNGSFLKLTDGGTDGFFLRGDTVGTMVVQSAAGADTAVVKVRTLLATATTVALLPATPIEGMRATVTDSNAVSFTAGIGSVAVGGGSTHVPVYYDGTNWRIG